MEKELVQIDILSAKMGYIIASISSYSSLTLSKILKEINQKMYLLKKSLIDQKEYIDIRDVVSLKDEVKEISKNLPEKEIYLEGHKIACLLFEYSSLIDLLIIDLKDKLNADIIEYLEMVKNYTFFAGRYINLSLLCYENFIEE